MAVGLALYCTALLCPVAPGLPDQRCSCGRHMLIAASPSRPASCWHPPAHCALPPLRPGPPRPLQAGLTAEVGRLSAQVAGLNEALETEQAARTVAAREAKEKGDKLDRLESEWGLGRAGLGWVRGINRCGGAVEGAAV